MTEIKLQAFETIQRAGNGGWPLLNESASDLGIGHGAPVVIIPKRKLLALIYKAMETTADKEFFFQLEELLTDDGSDLNDSFVVKIKSDELYTNETPTFT